MWTIGYGFTKGVQPGDTITKEQAKRRLARELAEYEASVLEACTNEPNQNEFDALVLRLQRGHRWHEKSSVIKAHKPRRPSSGGASIRPCGTKPAAKAWPGLTRRRAAEAALYLTPMPDDVSDPAEGPALDMPQAVDAERPMTASTINRASVVAGGTAAVA